MSDRPDPDSAREEREPTGPTVRDRRRIDPDTFQAREPQQSAPAPGADGAPDEPAAADQPVEDAADPAAPTDERVADLERQLGERLSDLQRVQAEYVNYKRRVDRDRETARQSAVSGVMTELLGVLDDVASAREHGELGGAFKAVGEAVEKLAARHGVAAFGTAGDPFDPNIHDALMQLPGAEDGQPVAAQVLQPGYRMGERVLRPARVAVGAADPGSATAGSPDDGAGVPGGDGDPEGGRPAPGAG